MIKEMEVYLAEFGKGRNNLSPATARNYKASLVLFSEYFKLQSVEEIGSIDESKFKEFIYSLTVKESTKNFHVRNICAFINYLLRNKNVSEKIDKQGITKALFTARSHYVVEGKREIVSLSNEEIEKIISVTGKQFRMMISFMLSTGLRAHEVCNLKVKDIDFENGKFSIRGKGDKPAKLGINKKTLEELLVYMKFHNGGEYLFYPTRGRGAKNEKLSPSTVNGRLKSAIELTDIPEERKNKITSHVLRKTLITRIAKKNILLAQKVARHSSINITSKYYVDDSDMAVDTLQNFDEF